MRAGIEWVGLLKVRISATAYRKKDERAELGICEYGQGWTAFPLRWQPLRFLQSLIYP